MHPAFSIIVFTSATGAGCGLLTILGVSAVFGLLPSDRGAGLVSLGTAIALIVAGLLSSTAHLGRPERAWRAFSQWRTSWLSREAIASLFTFLPTALFGIGWIALDRTDSLVAMAGGTMAASAMITVMTTGMIYASLKPVAQWNTPFTMPTYLGLAIMSGCVVFDAILTVLGLSNRTIQVAALTTIVAAWLWKFASWRHNDRLISSSSMNSATGLAGGCVRSIEWPHTEDNYLLKEMAYRVARKHVAKLRLIAQFLAFAIPLACVAAAFAAGRSIATVAMLVAVLAQAPGVLVERWLFFAEARHTISLYYGR